MKEIALNLFIGSDSDCNHVDNGFAVIHACKTCHQSGVGYRGNLSSSHPNYLIFEKENHLYLNMVDMDRELLPRYTNPIIKSAFVFIEKHINEKKLLIHCNQGQSRSPSIGLIYLARKQIIASSTYLKAKTEFSSIYTAFKPGEGIELYMQRNWGDIVAL